MSDEHDARTCPTCIWIAHTSPLGSASPFAPKAEGSLVRQGTPKKASLSLVKEADDA